MLIHEGIARLFLHTTPTWHVEEMVGIARTVATMHQHPIVKDRKAIRPLDRALPGGDNLVIAQMHQRKLGIVATPGIAVSGNVQRVAVAHAVQAAGRRIAVELPPCTIPADQAARANRLVPAVVAEDTLIEVA